VQVIDLGCETTKERRTLLAGVGFLVDAAAPLALLGPSGAGKSLALRCLLGLAPADLRVTGRVRFNEEEVSLADRARLAAWRGRRITLMPQAAAASLDPVRTVGRQLSEVLRVHDNREDSAARLLELVGLDASTFLKRVPLELSGGQAQRAALALALACRPAVLLADEPTASLDNVAQAQLLKMVRDVCEARGVGLVLVTHDLAVAASVCRRAVVLAEGRMVEEGEMSAIVAAPRHATTQALVAAARRVDASWGLA
jgi:ABC-type glutathione transport system ATPase component